MAKVHQTHHSKCKYLNKRGCYNTKAVVFILAVGYRGKDTILKPYSPLNTPQDNVNQ